MPTPAFPPSHSDLLDPDLTAAFAQGGEMGQLLRALESDEIGSPSTWGPALRHAVMQVLASPHPRAVLWGPGHLLLYNEAIRPFFAAKHPSALGRRLFDSFPETRSVMSSLCAKVMAGEPVCTDDHSIVLIRRGDPEEAFFTFSYLPIREHGRVAGILCEFTETTRRVVSERRIDTLQRLSLACAGAKDVCGVGQLAIQALVKNQHDLLATLVYLPDESVGAPRCVASCGLGPTVEGNTVPLHAWPFQQACKDERGVLVEPLPIRVDLPDAGAMGLASPSPSRALILPIKGLSAEIARGYLVVVLNPHVPFDDNYRTFLQLLSAHMGGAVERVEAWLRTQRRAEELAEIDRAKTRFFNNISHEFRTPLTLILAPIREAVERGAEYLKPTDLHVVYRNAQRLLKLVNALLDFARVEADRAKAILEPTDLAAFTRDIVRAFDSVAEHAGLTLVVSCPPLPTPVRVDRDMWEKIVLNLVSNAFKHTFSGRIEVQLEATAAGIEFTVRDTGSGIPPGDLPRIFERFARVEGRRHGIEGTGIGLSLVRELCRLHGGDVRAESQEGVGSVFTVTLPRQQLMLPPSEHVGHASKIHAAPYVDEAMTWFADAPSISPATSEVADDAPRLLLVDDNADMRHYLAQCLGRRWRIVTANDGVDALSKLRAQPADLVVTDIMMPNLDGLGLLRALRADPKTQTMPVILLSARAGEDATVRGLDTGADDYLAKPFSTRELVARVEAHLTLAAMRRQVIKAQHHIEELERGKAWAELLLNCAPTPMVLLRHGTGEIVFANRAAQVMAGGHLPMGTQAAGGPSTLQLTDENDAPIPPTQMPDARAARGEMLRDEEIVWHSGVGRLSLLVSAEQVPATHGHDAQTVLAFNDVTALRQTERRLRTAVRARDEFLSVATHELRTPLTPLLLRVSQMLSKLASAASPQLSEADTVLYNKAASGLARVLQHGARFEAVVSDLVDMARFNEQTPVFKAQTVDLHALVDKEIEALQQAGQMRQWGCDVRVHTDKDATGVWDPTYLGKLVRILLSNAIKFGLRQPVDVTLSSVGDGIALTVRDRGIGIALEDQTRIFERFTRAVSDRSYGGLGLGLWIAKSIIESCGGTLTVTSTPGRGTTFRAYLPSLIGAELVSRPDNTEGARQAMIQRATCNRPGDLHSAGYHPQGSR
jgi:signal transduction histidine kinase/CheY-like chemotaxis protein